MWSSLTLMFWYRNLCASFHAFKTSLHNSTGRWLQCHDILHYTNIISRDHPLLVLWHGFTLCSAAQHHNWKLTFPLQQGCLPTCNTSCHRKLWCGSFFFKFFRNWETKPSSRYIIQQLILFKVKKEDTLTLTHTHYQRPTMAVIA